MDVNTPVENPRLVAAINRIVEAETPENEEALIAELREAHFLSPVVIDPPPSPGESTLGEGTSIQFALLPGPEAYYPAFTDWGELRKWKDTPDQQTLITRLDDFCGMLDGNHHAGVIVNPLTQGLLLSRERLGGITGRTIAYTVARETKYTLGIPAARPDALIDTVRAYMRTRPAIRAAWFDLMIRDGEQCYLITVDCEGDPRALFDEIGRVAGPCLAPGELLDLNGTDNELGQTAMRVTELIYQAPVGLFGRLRSLFK